MRNVLVAVGVCLLAVINAAAQQPWTGNNTSDPTTRTGSVGIGTVTTPAAPLDISTGTTQAWINLSSSNALPPKINFMQSAPAALDLGIGSVNFTNGVGTVISQISARYPGTDQSQSYMRFTTSGLERLRIDSLGNVGIGTDAPIANSTQTGVEVKSNTTAALWMTGTSNQGAAIRGRNMNAGNTASAMDDVFLAMGGLGYDGSAFAPANRASIHFVASQAWTPANQGTYITFNTTPNNSTVRAERMRIDNAGNVGIGTSTPGAGLDSSKQEAPLHILSTQNKNTILLVQNLTNDVNVAPAFRTQADVAMQSFQSHASSRTIGRFGINALGGWNEFLSVSGNGLIMGTLAGPIILGTNNANRLQIAANGNVGVGLTEPGQKLSVAGWIESTSGGIKFPDGSLQSTAFSSNGSASVANASATGAATITAIAGDGTSTSNIAYLRVATNETTPKDWRIGMTDGTGTFKIRDNAGNADRMTISGSSITFNGNVTGTTILATYQDLAEWVPASETMTAGTVVVVGENGNNTVTASMHAYDTSVAGVVSASPGLLLGVASATKAKIATTGRVRVRVDATKSPIRNGDLLVTSDRPGMAMKSEPLDLGGVKLHRPGTLIGKALEPLESGQGVILVLLSLQ